MTKKRNIDSLAIMADKTDTFRVSEQIAVPHGKPQLEQLCGAILE